MFLCLRGKRNAETPHGVSPSALQSSALATCPQILEKHVLQHKPAKYPPQNLAYTQVSPTFAPLDIKFPARPPANQHICPPSCASGHVHRPRAQNCAIFFARRNALAFSELRPFQEKFPKISPKFLRQKFGVCAKSPYLCTRKSEMRPTTPHKSEAIRSLKTLHKTIL